MPTLRIPTPLRTYTDGHSEISVKGDTVSEVLDNLVSNYPAIQPHLFNESGQLRPFVNLYLGEENIRDLNGLQTQIMEDDRLLLIPSIAGG